MDPRQAHYLKRSAGSSAAAALARITNFKAVAGSSPSGIDRLPTALTINGTTVSPSLRYRGGDADTTDFDSWGYGPTLTYNAGGGAIAANNGAPGLGSSDDSVLFDGNAYYQDSGNTEGNVGTNDIVFSAIFQATGTTCVIAAKRNGGVGWEVGIDASDRLYATIQDSGGATTVVSDALTPGCIYSCSGYLDRSGSGQLFANGAQSGSAVDISSRASSLDNTESFALGADSGGASAFDSRLIYFAMYNSAAWLDTHLQGTVEKERQAKVTGVYPQFARGTATPVVMTRTTDAYMQKIESGGETKLYRVGANWPRVESKKDANGDTLISYLSENEGENEFTWSTDLDNADWAKTRATISGTTATAPDGTSTAQGIVSDSTPNTTHYIGQSIGSAAGDHEMSFYCAAGDKSWVYVNIPSVANANLYYDIANDAFGTVGVGIDLSYSENLGTHDGKVWRRIVLCYTGGVPAHDHNIYPAEADGDNMFTGDGSTVDIWVWGPQHDHNGCGRAASYIPTGVATATRTKDQLRYKGDDGNVTAGQGTVTFDLLWTDSTPPADLYLMSINDGGSSDEAIDIYIDTSGNVVSKITDSTVVQATLTSTTVVTDGETHEVELSWIEDDVRQYIDGDREGIDLDASIPSGLDRIVVCADSSQTNQLWGNVGNINILQKPTARYTYHDLLVNDQSTLQTTTVKIACPAGDGNIISLSWGDGSHDNVVCDGTLKTLTHDYSSTDTYTIQIRGDIQEITQFQATSQSFISGDISAFSTLTSLTQLNLVATSVSGDIGDLSTLTSLTLLHLGATSVSGDIGDLSTLTSLTLLYLYNTSVSGDIGDLSTLTSLTLLYLYSTSVSGDIGDLSTLTSLTQLYINSTSVSGDIGDLSTLTSLTQLHLGATSVSGDIGDLSTLTSLTLLYINNTSVSGDIGDLSTLTSLTLLHLGDTSVSGDIGDLSTLTSVTQLYLYSTNLTYTTTTLPAWASGTLLLYSTGLDSSEVDQFLIDFEINAGAGGTIDIAGTNQARTAASDAAVTSLTNAGRPGGPWVVTAN
jgi:hypothetical protein